MKLVRDFLIQNVCHQCDRKACGGNCKFYCETGRKLAYQYLNNTFCIIEKYKTKSALQVANDINATLGYKCFTNEQIMKIVEFCGGTLRTLKDAINLESSKDRRIKTNISKYGAINPLSKGTTAFDKKNRTVKEKYGCENVFQNEQIKEKIKETTFNHFGCYSQADPEVHKKTVATMMSKYGTWSTLTEESVRKNAESNKGNKHRITKPDLKVQEWMISQNISFLTEETFYDRGSKRWAQVDILVGNIAFEIMGTYWHADPRKYLSSDIVYHGKTAQEIWNRDLDRKKFLEDKFNVKVIYLWQQEIENNFNIIIDIIVEAMKNAHRENKENNSNS